MILSHKHKFIYFKTHKTAGTSTELALSRHCGSDDIVTASSVESEILQDGIYSNKPRNTSNTNSRDFRNHMSPGGVKKAIMQRYGNREGEVIWNTYYKIANVRDPWDRVVSYWCWDRNVGLGNSSWVVEDSFEEYVYNKSTMSGSRCVIHQVKPWSTIGGQVVIDKFIRFEYLQQDVNEVLGNLGLPSNKLPKAKGLVRKKACGNFPYPEYYNNDTRQVIHELFIDDINYFNYKFGLNK